MSTGTDYPFALGWSPESAANAAARTTYAKPTFKLAAPRPPAMSLTHLRRRSLMQWAAGTCWTHSATRLAETVTVAEGHFEHVPLCRALIGWEGKQLEGGGNQANGGNATDALYAMTTQKGIGAAHESLYPYVTQDMSDWQCSAYLAKKPPAAAIADAKGFHLGSVAKVEDDEAAKDNIAAGFGDCNGIWWPYGFDDPKTATSGCLFSTYRGGEFGHSLYEAGYVEAGVWPGTLGKYAWWQLDNWHDERYGPLPAELAALVPGYVPSSPDKTTDFWVRDDCYASLIHDRNAERVTACGVTGWTPLLAPWKWEDIS